MFGKSRKRDFGVETIKVFAHLRRIIAARGLSLACGQRRCSASTKIRCENNIFLSHPTRQWRSQRKKVAQIGRTVTSAAITTATCLIDGDVNFASPNHAVDDLITERSWQIPPKHRTLTFARFSHFLPSYSPFRGISWDFSWRGARLFTRTAVDFFVDILRRSQFAINSRFSRFPSLAKFQLPLQ